MARVFYIHWNQDEALAAVRLLRGAGHTVDYHWSTEVGAKINAPPEVFVISLDRLPSHGRAVAEYCREKKSLRGQTSCKAPTRGETRRVIGPCSQAGIMRSPRKRNRIMVIALYIVGGIVALVAILFIIGLTLPRTHLASSVATFHQPPEKLWAAISDFPSMPGWAPGVASVERMPDLNGHPVWAQIGKMGRMPLELEVVEPPHKLVGRIAADNLGFGGKWTYVITPAEGGATMTITEDGFIDNVMFRAMARLFFGYHGTQQAYLRAVGKKFGEAVTPVRVDVP